jgi:acyl-coenzyme A synthetase/AMP-(fatty) acid ligase
MEMANRQRRLTNAEIESALCRHGGVVSLAAIELGVSRQAIYYRLSVSPHLRAKADDQRGEFLDYCMEAILQGIKARHGPTLRWYADHFMRDRGYGR